MKFDPTVRRELGWVTLGTLLLTAVEIGVFFALGYYTADVLYGAILSAAGGIADIFLLAVAVTRALSYPPEEEAAAKGILKLSRIARMTLLLAVLAVGVILFNPVSTLVTIAFPRAVIVVQTVAEKRKAAAVAPAPVADEPDGTEPDETGAPEEGDAAATPEPETKGSEEDGTNDD